MGRRAFLGLIGAGAVVGAEVALSGCATVPRSERQPVAYPSAVLEHMNISRQIEGLSPQPDIWRAGSLTMWTPNGYGAGSLMRTTDGGFGILSVKHVVDFLKEKPTESRIFMPGLERIIPETNGILHIDPAGFELIESEATDCPMLLRTNQSTEALAEAERQGLIQPLEFGEKTLQPGFVLHATNPTMGDFTSYTFGQYITDPLIGGFELNYMNDGYVCAGRSGTAVLSSTVDGSGVSNKVYGVLSSIAVLNDQQRCSPLAYASGIR